MKHDKRWTTRHRPGRCALALVLLHAAALWGCGAAAQEPGASGGHAEALRHLEEITANGSRPSGSKANLAAATYLAETLAGWGWEVTVQEGVGISRQASTAGRVRNVIGWLPAAPAPPGSRQDGEDRDAVLFAAHYDSVVDGPGAMDNAASVAAVLVAARQLSESPRRARPALVLFSDAEERYLLGADLFVRESPLARRVAAVFNFDHSGRGGPLFAFEVSPPNQGMLDALRAVSPAVGGLRPYSFGADVYKLLPFDTDFTVLRTLGVPGVNFAFAGDGYAYHTRLDEAPGIPAASLTTLVDVAGALARHLVAEGAPLGSGMDAGSYATYFPIGSFTVTLGGTLLWVLALLVAAAALFLIAGGLRRDGRGVLRCWLAVGLGFVLSIAVLTGVVAALRTAAAQHQVAYAYPWPFFALLAAAVFALLLLSGRLTGKRETEAPTRMAAVMAIWLLLTAAFVSLAPGSAAFFLLPLAGLVVAGLLRRLWRGPGGTITAGIIAVGAVFLAWAGPLAALLPLLITTLPKGGPEPLLFWPVVVGFLGTLLGTVPWAFVGGHRTSRRALVVVAVGATAALAGVLIQAPYDADRPQRVWTFHVSGAAEPYQVLASTDRLAETPEARRGRGPDLDDLFWIGPGWWRAVESSEFATPLPGVQVEREGRTVVVEVDPPPGADVVLLRLPRAGIDTTSPPTPAQGWDPMMVLRWIVAEGEKPRFVLEGQFAEDARARVMSVAPGLPAGAGAGGIPTRPEWIVGERTIAFTDVTLPVTGSAAEGRNEEPEQDSRGTETAPDELGD